MIDLESELIKRLTYKHIHNEQEGYIVFQDCQGREHSLHGPAVIWDDGYVLYYIHGVEYTVNEYNEYISKLYF